MLTKRIIPCLDVHNGQVTRGQQFGRAEKGELANMGDPVEMAKEYDRQGADELVFYDITATSEGRSMMIEVITQVAEQCFMPITIGGGVRSIDDFRSLFLAGADKVSINSGAVKNPKVIREASEHYGAQAVVLSIDVKKRSDKDIWDVYVAGGRKKTDLDMLEWAVRGQELGAGELVINSIDADGMNTGYDIKANKLVRAAVDIPIVASGGAGSPKDMRDVLALTNVDAALAAGIFHRGEFTVAEVKQVIADAGILVRII